MLLDLKKLGYQSCFAVVSYNLKTLWVSDGRTEAVEPLAFPSLRRRIRFCRYRYRSFQGFVELGVKFCALLIWFRFTGNVTLSLMQERTELISLLYLGGRWLLYSMYNKPNIPSACYYFNTKTVIIIEWKRVLWKYPNSSRHIASHPIHQPLRHLAISCCESNWQQWQAPISPLSQTPPNFISFRPSG